MTKFCQFHHSAASLVVVGRYSVPNGASMAGVIRGLLKLSIFENLLYLLAIKNKVTESPVA